MDEKFVRTALIFGEDGMRRLSDARVAVFGVGGVGGHLVQALARAGVGHITVIDDDVVSVSNINRQAVAMDSTVGRPKVEVIAEQVRDINPACEVTPLRLFYTPENAETLNLARFDAIADCIDTVKAKVTLICRAKEAGVYAISAMGAGNKLDPSRLRVAYIEKTSVCPLARVMRTELRKRRIRKLKVVFSDEQPIKPDDDPALSCRNHCICPPGTVRKCTARRDIPGSTAFVPPAMGIMIASEIVRDLIAAAPHQA